MAQELASAMVSLMALMEEESAMLGRPGGTSELAEIAGAKVKLAGWIEAEFVRLRRESPDWVEALAPEVREQLAEISLALRDTSQVNAQLLERQIELSVDLMAAIAAEAQRLTGRRSATYSARGGLKHETLPAPISINTRL